MILEVCYTKGVCALLNENLRYKLAADNTSDVVVLVDTRAIVRYVSPSIHTNKKVNCGSIDKNTRLFNCPRRVVLVAWL
jgi:hypothetical protein